MARGLLAYIVNEAPRSKLRGITELNFEDFSEAEANPVASYGEYSSLNDHTETTGREMTIAEER